MEPNKIKVIVCKPGKNPEIKEISNDLDTMQKIVGGYIEIYRPFNDEVCIVCNETGKEQGLQMNKILCDSQGRIKDFIVGTFFLCGCTITEFCSLTEEQQMRYVQKFRRTTCITN